MVRTPAEALRQLKKQLEPLCGASADFEAKQLLCFVLQCSPYMLPDAPLTQQEEENLSELLTRRLQHEPLQYLFGTWDFYGLEFRVGEGVLIPRQDTEVLVERVLQFRKSASETKLLDLCSGSGCIPSSIAQNLPYVTGAVMELSSQALVYLRENLQHYAPQLAIVQGDVLEPPEALLTQSWDVITCNPPYLTQKDMEQLQEEVRYEPKTALFGGTDGLEFYRRLTPLWSQALVEGGMLIYEIGMGQEQAVAALLEQAGLKQIEIIPDLCGINRVVSGIKEK